MISWYILSLPLMNRPIQHSYSHFCAFMITSAMLAKKMTFHSTSPYLLALIFFSPFYSVPLALVGVLQKQSLELNTHWNYLFSASYTAMSLHTYQWSVEIKVSLIKSESSICLWYKHKYLESSLKSF